MTSAAIEQPRRVVANMAAKGTAFAVEKGAQLAMVIVAGRTLGEARFGRFAFASSLAVVLAFATDLGLTIWTTRALARRGEATGPLLATGLRMRLAASAVVMAAFAGVALAVEDRGLAVAVLALGAAALARGLCDHARAVFRANERLGDEGKLNTAIAVLGMGGGIAGLLAGAGGIAALALGILAGTLAGAAYGFLLLGRNYGPWAGPADWTLARRMLREAAPFYLAGAFTLVYARADVLLLKLRSFDTEVGAYRAAGQLVEVVKQLPVLLMTATFPQLARGFHESRAALIRTERAIMGLLLGSGVLLGAALALAADPIIMLPFGADFGRAVPALRTLALAVPLQFVNCGVLHFFIARDRGGLNMAFAAAMVVVNGGTNLALDGVLGAVGAAAATVVTEAALLACCLYALGVLRREAPSR
ncbi:MAG TPA: oligosaccharide flippase family protein [Polyangia bacterium]